MDPGHQCRPDTLTLPGRIDRDPTDMQVAGLALVPEASDVAPTDRRHGAASADQVVTDPGFRLAQRTAWWVEPAVILEGELGQAVDIDRRFGSADGNPEPGR